MSEVCPKFNGVWGKSGICLFVTESGNGHVSNACTPRDQTAFIDLHAEIHRRDFELPIEGLKRSGVSVYEIVLYSCPAVNMARFDQARSPQQPVSSLASQTAGT